MKSIVSIALILSTFNTYSQNYPMRSICSANHKNASMYIVSDEIPSTNGQFTVTLVVKAIDTLDIDQLILDSVGYLALSANNSSNSILQVETPWFDETYLLPGDSAMCEIEIEFDTAALPFYPVGFDLQLVTHKHNDTMLRHAFASTKVYFTPYNTVEVWNMQDFNRLPRVWENPLDTPPTRIYVHPDSIPTSTRPDLSTLTESWQTDYQMCYVPGLPYMIEMEALHPDTIAARRYRDSVECEQYINDGTIGKKFMHGKRFIGEITGRLVAYYMNDLGNVVKIPIGGVKLEAYDREGSNPPLPRESSRVVSQFIE